MIERRSTVNGEVDPVEHGRLLAAVENLTTALTRLEVKVDNIEARMNTGRGLALGVGAALATAGGSIGALAHKLLENIK